MTGFGEGALELDGWRIGVTARSVNHRQLDVRWSGPSSLFKLEADCVAAVRARLRRGRVDLRVTAETDGTRSRSFERPEVQALVETLTRTVERYGLAGGVTLDALIRAGGPQLLADDVALDPEAARGAVLEAAGAAVDALCRFREREGAALQGFFGQTLDRLAAIIDELRALIPVALEHHRDRLAGRVEELLMRVGAGAVTPERLEQEIVLVAERSDIAEELLRAREHLSAVRALIASESEAGHGKRLDFLLQELFRECNTMASKSSSGALTQLVVEAKTAVEQMREQAANVE